MHKGCVSACQAFFLPESFSQKRVCDFFFFYSACQCSSANMPVNTQIYMDTQANTELLLQTERKKGGWKEPEA